MSDEAASMILAALRRLETGQDNLRTERAALRGGMMDRTDRLENKLTGIRTERT